MPNKPTTLRESTTIQTIKEAEDKIAFPLHKAEFRSALLTVFESELENLPYAGNETHTEQQIVDDENYPQEERGVVTERLRIRSHLTEVINYLKQK